uniref:Cupin domain n=1 Tax=Candidatus Kentrum sp. SD TaxID=2126332 RepID=A0A451BN46_9GAMM|nr:MAG: Cupin domain [Candidatus Kentron sp. SD]
MKDEKKTIDVEYSKKAYGVAYFEPGERTIIEAAKDDLYFYKTFIGEHIIKVKRGDCVFFISKDISTAHLERGETKVTSYHMATVIRGYMPENKTSGLLTKTYLPYVNACSTKQVFPPERLGDPTLQILDIPPYSFEQAHHIHSTVRVVYVISGMGRSIVGMENNTITEDLYPGKVIVLQKMCPHHFETDAESLIVLPLHIFSSVGTMEFNHPMFHGTYLVDQIR